MARSAPSRLAIRHSEISPLFCRSARSLLILVAMAVAAFGPQWERKAAPKPNKKQRPKSASSSVAWRQRVVAVAARVSPSVEIRPSAKQNTRPISKQIAGRSSSSACHAQRRATRKNRRQAIASSEQNSHTSWVMQASQKAQAGVSAGARGMAGQGRKVVIAAALCTGFLGAVFGGLGAASYLQESPVFHAKNLAFTPTEHMALDDVRALLAPAVDQSLWSLDLDALEARLEASPWVADAKVVRMLPDTLKVQVQEHIPVAQTSEKGERWLVDSAGRLFQVPTNEAPEELPQIHGITDHQVTPPEQRERRLQIALDALERFSVGSRPLVRSVQVGAADEIALELRDIPTRLHFEQSDLDRGLARFDALFAAAPDRFMPGAGDAQHDHWSAVFFNGADRNRVVVRYADRQVDSLDSEAVTK